MFPTLSGAPRSQNKKELEALVEFMKARNLTRYLEIGAFHGDTFHYIMTNIGMLNAYGVALDLPGGPWGRGHSETSLRNAVDLLLDDGYECDLVLGHSSSPNIVEGIGRRGVFDLIMVDADRRYEQLKQTFYTYRPYGRYFAFCGIAAEGIATRQNQQSMPVDVPRFWSELKQQFSYEEFVESREAGAARGILCRGIGVIEIPELVQGNKADGSPLQAPLGTLEST